MADRRVRARPGEGALLREEILRAAEALLAEAGSEEALTLRAVAARTGVSTPSVYLHFADKEALVEAVCLRVWDELARRVGDVSGAPEPFAALGRCARAYVWFALDHPVQYRLVMMRPCTAEPVARAGRRCFDVLAGATAACVEAGVMRGDPRHLALGLWAGVHGLVSLLIAQPAFPWPDDLEALVDHTVRASGLGAALASRLPRHGLPPIPALVDGLDAAAARLAPLMDDDRGAPVSPAGPAPRPGGTPRAGRP
ncbi:TetR/AcrR family transcriptional regulator [Sphaerisporangium sp. TRM90804]|uniref:TetR/AcrR family transcriptional regulator n=1 Tax=Sphaerisporangium sp. TRM90804 TaxID=3031113 RepID=UPI00244B44E7|nr:TetR/AcrR family transcriptional regulator [Sphaerisporangium sp. TRM90804]MDH2430188.1 TetR/AcrR family transcriptional regulator [Sphaerisporangium sp. TRM90804]